MNDITWRIATASAGGNCVQVAVTDGTNYATRAVQAITDAEPSLPTDLAALYALLVLVKGREATMRDVHDAWSIWCQETHPDHADLISFEKLPPDVQERDRRYMDSIHSAAGEVLVDV